MAKKPSVRYVCGNCGAFATTWSGRCPQCGEWNSLQEQIDIKSTISAGSNLQTANVAALAKEDTLTRLKTGIADVDEVLGGGVVPGSVTLIAGQPGIGKSTLLLQIAQLVAAKHSVVYISGEESAHQIGLRAARIGAKSTKLQLATSNSAEDIATTISTGGYKLVVVDSIQTVSHSAVSSAAGSVSQITNCTQLLTAAAKQSNSALMIVGHVTKEGSIAGPKLLEHMVDVVLQLEGDRYGGFKLLRGIKNRFGSTNETGIFEMINEGLKQVENPSAALLAERQVTDGSVVLATMEGSRPLLVEVQALVNRTSYGYPKRAASGFDLNRLNLLVAMLERRTKLSLADQDIYVNIVGGIKITEPAADLAVVMAIASAAKGLQLKEQAVVFGEVGLSGEIRHVPQLEKRLSEAKKLGFTSAIGPVVRSGNPSTKLRAGKLSMLKSVSDVRSALNEFLSKD